VIVGVEPPELLVSDQLTPCPYLPGQTARMPLRLPIRPLRRAEWAERLTQGDRRHGAVLYRTMCPECSACEPIRVDVARFVFSRNQRRVLRRVAREIEVEIGVPTVDKVRLDLYEKHLSGRALQTERHSAITPARFRSFLVESSCDAMEIRYLREGCVVGVAITDRTDRSLSAHYTFYDPDLSSLGLGTFSILTQIELCQRWELDHLYLGLYIADCKAMSYKARFLPHERLIDGVWRSFSKNDSLPR